MKQFFTTVFCLFIICFSNQNVLYAQNLDNPGDYISAISNAEDAMNTTYMAYLSEVAHSGRARKIEKMRQQTVESITDCKYKIIDLPIYKGDNSLRQASIAYVDICYKVFNEDYAHIVNMEDIAEQSYDEMQAYLLLREKTDEKIDTAAARMDQNEKEFAAKYNVNLIDTKSELSEKMDIAGKLTNYHNQVYLIFFKCNWEDGQLTDALNKKNVNNTEQARNALINYANDGLAGLDSLRNFEGDASLAETCRQALTFYKNMAQNDIPNQTAYFLKEENFEKIKTAFDNKDAGSRTKADVDAYNKAVNDMNAAVNVFNQTNANTNSKRAQILQNWENTEKSFEDAHMPYYKK